MSLGRDVKRLEGAIQVISVAKISGAVGTFSHISPEVEKFVAKQFNLQPAIASTQIIQRDRHAEFMVVLAVVAGTLEKMALEVRHLQRTEVLEVEEPFTKGQKGSRRCRTREILSTQNAFVEWRDSSGRTPWQRSKTRHYGTSGYLPFLRRTRNISQTRHSGRFHDFRNS